ncbi:MAG: hypothetical protein PHI11_14920 [Gallionella sp.]|nr:hypothetical protein [Gallionella sp.]
MRNHDGRPSIATLLIGGALLGLVTQSALAAGTSSGTPIINTATLAYSVAGVGQTGIAATAPTFLVDEKVNLTVTGGATTNVVPGQLATVTTFSVTNFANSPLDFSLAATPAIVGDNFDPTACSVFVESGVTVGYQAGVDIATFVDELAADASKVVYVVCNIPGTVVNTNTALVGLTATAQGTFTGLNGIYVATAGAQGAAILATAAADTPATVDIVFADIAGTEVGDLPRDAKHSARDTYLVATSVLTVTKTVALLCDPFNGTLVPKNIPGAITQWSVSIANTGSAAATLTTISDTLTALVLAHDANLVVPSTAANCVSATGIPESLAGRGFKVTASAARTIGATLATTVGYFTTLVDADGVDIAGQAITATFAAILPIDGTHLTAGLLNVGETVTIVFNATEL